MMKWMFLVVAIISAAVLAFLYVNIEKVGPGTSSGPVASTQTITVNHAYQDGVHRFSGEIRLPHSCYSVDPVAFRDPQSHDNIIIQITATDHLNEWTSCAKYSTRYQFQVIEDAPPEALYTLEVNGVKQSTRTVEISWESSNGTFMNRP